MPNSAYFPTLSAETGPLKPTEWIGTALRDLRTLPDEPRRAFGFAIHLAQLGRHHVAAKRLKGEFAGLIEVVDAFDGATYRAIYTTKLADVVYVLHVFQKQSTRGIATPARDEVPVTRGGANIYADLGFADPAEEVAKAKLALLIDQAIQERELTQKAAATLMAVDQPKVSHILHGRLGGFSTQRLMEFLTALGRDVEIVVREAPRSRKRGRLRITAARR